MSVPRMAATCYLYTAQYRALAAEGRDGRGTKIHKILKNKKEKTMLKDVTSRDFGIMGHNLK
jgi:hypothetical protein